jgi:hypothetical protein
MKLKLADACGFDFVVRIIDLKNNPLCPAIASKQIGAARTTHIINIYDLFF